MTVWKALMRQLGWCHKEPSRPNKILPLGFAETSSVLVCLSASFFMLGTYLATLEELVWVGNEYELMHIYLPISFLLWLLSLLSLVYGTVLGVRKQRIPSGFQFKTVFSKVSLIVGVTLGVLTLTSTLLPWIIAERVNPIVELRDGTLDVGQYHTLTAIKLFIGTNRVDEVSLAFVGAIISIVHIPLLSLLNMEKPDAMKAFLFLLSGVCIIYPLTSIYTRGGWWFDVHMDGILGFTAVFKSLGLGFLIATACAIGLITFGVITTIKIIRLVFVRQPKLR